MAEENRARPAAALRRLDKHDHLCIIYKTRDEQFASVLPFIRIGLERGEKCVYIADENSAAAVLTAMKQDGIDVESAVKSGALTVAAKQDAYLQQGSFDPDWMIRFLKESTNSVKSAGFSGLRIAGEMTWALGGDPGVERLIEYESKLNRFFSEHDCLGICQYNINAFNPETLIDVIRTHPLVIYRDLVCRNYFYVPTDEFLKTRQPRLEMDRLLKSILAFEQSKDGLKQLADMLQAAPLAVIRLSLDRKILAFNAEAERIYRCSQEQVLNHDYFRLFVADKARPLVEAEMAKAGQGEATRGFENAVKTADGRERILAWHVSRVEEANGTPAGVVCFGEDITERKESEERLRSTESLLRTVLSSAPITIFATDDQGVFTLSEGKGLESAGLKPGENVGVSALDLYASLPFVEQTGKVTNGKDVIRRALAGKTVIAFSELPGACFENRISPLRDAKGKIVGIVGVGTDITERMQADEALKSSEAKYRNLFETMTQGVVYLDAGEQRITSANPAAARILGLSMDQILGKTPYDSRWRAVHEDGSDWPGETHPVAMAMKTGKPVRSKVQGVFIPEEGEYHWLNINAMPKFHKGEKEPYQVYATFEDITERKQAENEVKDAKELLEKTFASLQEAVFVIDLETRTIESCNQAAEKMFGYSSDEMIGRATEFLHVNKEMFEDFGRDLKPQFETTGAFQCEWKMRRRNGDVFDSEHTVTVMREDGQRTGIVSVVRDITERKQRADELRARVRQQAAVAELGNRALAGKAMDELFNDAVVLAKEALEVDLCKVLQLLPDGRALLLKAGVGWREGLVGQAKVGSGKESQAGYTLLSDKPVIVEDLSKETRFSGPQLLRDHGVVSGISVVIGGPDQQPFGVMGAHSRRRRAFTVEDANFLQAMANTISVALERAKAQAEIKNERDKALESEANFRAVTETTGAAIFVIQGTKFRYQNQAAEALTGYGPKEISRLNFWDIVHPDFQDLVKARGAARLAGEKVPSRYEFKMITKGGEERWLDYSGTIIDFEGQPAILGTALDVTEKKRGHEVEKRRELDIRQAYVDVLAAVTGGKLIIATPAEIEAVLGRPLGGEITVATSEDINEAKVAAKEIVRDELPGMDIFGLMVAAVEALANAVKHGGGGSLRLFGADGKVQMAIEDSGPGINFSILPKATLSPGFSTKQSLGMGFGIMLEESDRVLLATEPGRTIVVLEKERRAEKRLPRRAAKKFIKRLDRSL